MKTLVEFGKTSQALYIQGFVDGEGCCTKDGRQIIITQKDPEILMEIQASLNKTFGINSTLHYIKSNDVHRLIITGQVSIQRFCHHISFRDIKKQTRLQRGITNFKNRAPSFEDYSIALKLRKEGYSLRKIAKKIGVSYGAIFKCIAKPVSLPARRGEIKC